MLFKNKKAVNKVATAFSKETNNKWTVICKITHSGTKCYKPCMVKDYTNDVKRDGWFID
jgi:hypothetical protein